MVNEVAAEESDYRKQGRADARENQAASQAIGRFAPCFPIGER